MTKWKKVVVEMSKRLADESISDKFAGAFALSIAAHALDLDMEGDLLEQLEEIK